MNIVFNADDAFVKVYESLQQGARSREITTDWTYVQGISLTSSNRVKTTPQIGLGYDQDEIVGDDLKLSIDLFDTGVDFERANSSTIKYLIDVQYYDEVEQQTITYTLKECTPVSAGLTNAGPNKVSREWKPGSYVKS